MSSLVGHLLTGKNNHLPKNLQIMVHVFKIMAFRRSQLSIISTYIFLVLMPYSDSLTFNFTKLGPENQNRDIEIKGYGAYISDDGIQVTPDDMGSVPSRVAGRATYIRPLHLWDNTTRELANFTTDFSFVIDSKGSTSSADGLTFFLAQNNNRITDQGAMGLPVSGVTYLMTNPFVAVEFDTYSDPDWDPDSFMYSTESAHVGIDINSLTSVRYLKWLSDVSRGRECHAWIRYDSVTKNLSVSFTGFQNNTVVRQVGLDYTIDLREVLPEWVIVGFSAATGAIFEKNTVKSWAFSSSDFHSLILTKGENRTWYVVGLIILICFLVILLALLALVVWKKKNKTWGYKVEKFGFDIETSKEFGMGTGPKRFSYEELARATAEFAEKEKLGKGGFGGVYKGFLEDSSTYVAVKRVSKSSKQGIKEYSSEVKIIGKLRHRNLVKLTGWCHEKGELMLVYEYMENGSLDLHLFKGKSLLPWCTRREIAHGLAYAVLYLHEEGEKCVLHRDIKSSNVMLDSKFNAKLGDFGLAKMVDHEKGSHTTMLAGSMGYMAPEYVRTRKASRKSDVFSYGVVALEIACGRKVVDNKAEENHVTLVERVWRLYRTGMLLEAVDPLLGSDFEEDEIRRLLIVGLWCANPDSSARPSMWEAIQVLKFGASLPCLPSTMPVATYFSPPVFLSCDDSSIPQIQSSTNSDNMTTAATSSSSSSSSVSLLHSV